MAAMLTDERQESASFICRDEVTGLANRNAFTDACAAAIIKAGEEQRLALHILHIRNLKDLVIHYGLHVAEGALKSAASRLYGVFQSDRIFARLDSDHLGVLQVDVPHDGHALYLARRIFECLKEPIELQEQSVSLELCIGIGLCPDHGMDFGVLYHCAMMALNRADEAGPGQCRIFEG